MIGEKEGSNIDNFCSQEGTDPTQIIPIIVIVVGVI